LSDKASELREKEEEFWIARSIGQIETKSTAKRGHEKDSKEVDDSSSDQPMSKKLKSKVGYYHQHQHQIHS